MLFEDPAPRARRQMVFIAESMVRLRFCATKMVTLGNHEKYRSNGHGKLRPFLIHQTAARFLFVLVVFPEFANAADLETDNLP